MSELENTHIIVRQNMTCSAGEIPEAVWTSSLTSPLHRVHRFHSPRGEHESLPKHNSDVSCPTSMA